MTALKWNPAFAYVGCLVAFLFGIATQGNAQGGTTGIVGGVQKPQTGAVRQVPAPVPQVRGPGGGGNPAEVPPILPSGALPKPPKRV